MTIDLRGGAEPAPLSSAPPRVLIAVAGVSSGSGASMVAATIADAAVSLTNPQGEPVSVALLYPTADMAAQDLKSGATDLQPVDHGMLRGHRESGALFVMPDIDRPSPSGDDEWFAACGFPDLLVVDVASDDVSTWLGTAAQRTTAVYVARPSIPSIRYLPHYLTEAGAISAAFAVVAATTDTPDLVAMLTATAADQPLATAFFPLDHDLAVTGVPAVFPDTQLVTARDLLTRIDVLEGVPA